MRARSANGRDTDPQVRREVRVGEELEDARAVGTRTVPAADYFPALPAALSASIFA